jgi:tetratricopeptide (TPR) repeat protein
MSSKPNHTPRGDRKAAERQFVDREEFVAPVQSALKEPPRTKPLVLVYYGGAGIGKSRLRRELVRQLARDPDVQTATLDFTIPTFRQPETALLALRNSLVDTYQVRFPSFDIAYAFYRQKAHPDTALRSEEGGERREAGPESEFDHKDTKAQVRTDESGMQTLLEPGSLLLQLLDQSGKLPLIGLIPKVSALVGSRQHVVDRAGPTSNLPPSTYYLEWWERRGERELEDIPQMEPGAIAEQLPRLWAADLKEYLGAASLKLQASSQEPDSPLSTPHSRRAVLFIDSYEKLWEIGQAEADFFKRDEWVRELVKQLPEALWIICGRQKLRWEEVEPDWTQALSQHQLGALPDKSARRFLESCDITSGQIQDAIVKGSQGVPHYLDLAVDTIQSTKSEVRSTKFRGEGPDELVAQFTRQLDQPEIETLKVLSATRFWYYGLFENLITKYQTGYPLTGFDDLSRFSFVKEGAAPGTRTMHELMREALQESQSPELRKRVHLFLHELYAKQLEGLDVKSITDQQQVALTEAFYHGRQSRTAAELLAWFESVQEVFHEASLYRLLVPLCRVTVQAVETELGPNHPNTATALGSLADMVQHLGDYDEAESLYRRALAISESDQGREHGQYLDLMQMLVVVLDARGRFEEAEVLGRRLVTKLEGRPSSDAGSRAGALDCLAMALTHQGKYPEAEELLRREIAISETQLGPDHDRTIAALNSLSILFFEQGRDSESLALSRRVLEAQRRKLGPNNREVVKSMGGLAASLRNLRRFNEAEPMLRQVLKLEEEMYGPEHAITAVTMNNLAALLADTGRYAEAEALLRRALAAHKRKTGPDHPYTIRMANALISVLCSQGKYAEAESIALSTVAQLEKKRGPDHPDTTQTLHTAGVLYKRQGRYGEAESYLRRAYEVRSRVLGPEHPDTVTSLGALALLEEERGRNAEAEPLCRDALDKLTRTMGPEHPFVAITAMALARICGRDGRHAEAETFYRRALAIREKVFGPDHAFVAETLEGLAELCGKTGRAAEAQELSARAKSIRDQNAKG